MSDQRTTALAPELPKVASSRLLLQLRAGGEDRGRREGRKQSRRVRWSYISSCTANQGHVIMGSSKGCDVM